MEKHKFMNNLKLPNQLVCMYLDWSKWGNLEKPHTEAVKTFNIQKLVLVKQQDCGCGAFPMQLTTRCHCWNVLVSAKPTTLHNVLLCQIVVECGRSLDLSHVMHESLLCWLSDCTRWLILHPRAFMQTYLNCLCFSPQSTQWKSSGREMTKSSLHMSGRDPVFTSPVSAAKPSTPVSAPQHNTPKEVKTQWETLFLLHAYI